MFILNVCLSVCVYMHTCIRTSQRQQQISGIAVTGSDVGFSHWGWELNFTSLED